MKRRERVKLLAAGRPGEPPLAWGGPLSRVSDVDDEQADWDADDNDDDPDAG
jgi:hypothetical protein